MKLTKTEASAIGSQLLEEAKESSKRTFDAHLKSAAVKKECERLWPKIQPLLREKFVRVSVNDWYGSISSKLDLQESIAKRTYREPSYKSHSLVVQEVIIAAISANNVEQIKKKVKVLL